MRGPSKRVVVAALAALVLVASMGQVRITRSWSGVPFALFGDGSETAPSISFQNDSDTGFYRSSANSVSLTLGAARRYFLGSYFALASDGSIQWSSTTDPGAVTDLILARDAANVLAQKNGTNAQTVRIYNTTSGADSEYAYISGGGGSHFTLGTAKTGAGGVKGWQFEPLGAIFFRPGGSTRWTMDPSSGDMVAASGQGPAITQGSGTGITVVSSGSSRDVTYKVTVDRTFFVCAATTCDVTLGTLPAKTFVSHVLADLTTTFACTATCTSSTLSATVGKTAGGNEYLVSWDMDAATTQRGDAAAELGASLTEATIPTAIGDLASWTATTAVVLRLTSGTGNIGTGAATNLSQGSVTFYITTRVYP